LQQQGSRQTVDSDSTQQQPTANIKRARVGVEAQSKRAENQRRNEDTSGAQTRDAAMTETTANAFGSKLKQTGRAKRSAHSREQENGRGRNNDGRSAADNEMTIKTAVARSRSTVEQRKRQLDISLRA
jgi:hypothetical protein